MTEFLGKVALITGSSSGIGAAIALKLSELGANVVITGRDETRIAEVVQKCNTFSSPNVRSIGIRAELTRDNEVTLLVEKTVQEFGRIDILVANAGWVRMGTIKSCRYIQDFDEIFALKVRSVQVLTKLVLPYLEESKGNFINIGGSASKIPYPAITAFSMTESAMDVFTKCLALQFGPKGVRCNNIICGVVVTPAIGEGQDEYYEFFRQNYPLRKVVETKDVAELVAFVISEKAHCITGAEIAIECGHLIASIPANQLFDKMAS